MTEVRRADPGARRQAVLLVMLGALVGALLIVGFERYRMSLGDWLLSEPGELAHRVKLVFFAVRCRSVSTTGRLGHLSLVAWRQGPARGAVSTAGVSRYP